MGFPIIDYLFYTEKVLLILSKEEFKNGFSETGGDISTVLFNRVLSVEA